MYTVAFLIKTNQFIYISKIILWILLPSNCLPVHLLTIGRKPYIPYIPRLRKTALQHWAGALYYIYKLYMYIRASYRYMY